tara:strand:- start:4440 stop:4991 length:552 start_codon:yes stop_codon:yes gene_type:complete
MQMKDKRMMEGEMMAEEPTVALAIEIESAEGEDEMMYEEMAPSGRYSRKQLNNLVAATNRLLPLFEQTPDYPQFDGDLDGKLPTDFVRVLAMFQGAVNAAVDADVLDSEMDFVMEDMTDDMALQSIAGKITAIAGNREFRSFLRNPPEMEDEPDMEEVSGAETAMEGEDMSSEQMDNLFAGRM